MQIAESEPKQERIVAFLADEYVSTELLLGDGSMTHTRCVAALGDSENVGASSGIPCYLLHVGREVRFLTSGLNPQIDNLAILRGIW